MLPIRFVDIHNHCREFSPDASQLLSDRIKEAQAKGLTGIAMSDHYDKDLVDKDVIPNLSPMGSKPLPGEWIFYFPDYIKRLQEERKILQESDSDFQLLIGVELGYAPLLAEPYRELINNWPLDSIIASLHNLEFKDVYHFRELYEREKKDVYTFYLENVIQMINDMDYANILGHFDYISRYAHYSSNKLLYRDFPDVLDSLFRTLIENQTSLELNMGSQRSKDSDGTKLGLPDRDLLVRYRELGGELISLGSDSHYQGFVGVGFEETAKYLASLGYQSVVHFVERKPVHTSIKGLA